MQKDKGVKIALTILMGIFVSSMVLPFLWMVSTSFKYEADVFKFPIEWIPTKWNAVDNYKTVFFGKYNFVLYFWNTFKVTILATLIQVISSAMAGYSFAKIKYKGREVLFVLYLSLLMIPPQITIVPKFVLYRWLGLSNTHTGLVLIYAFSVFGTFLMRQYMTTIPDEMIESAKVDGAGHLRIFSYIILPLARPMLATLALLKIIWTWNDFQNPLIFISSDKLYTIQLGLSRFSDDYGTQYTLVMAASVLAILPLFALYVASQKHVIEGMTAGAVKG